MTIRQAVALSLIAAAIHFHGTDASAQSRGTSSESSKTELTWGEFVTDLKPYLKLGETGAAIGQKFWDKYHRKPVEWAGKFKSCYTREGKVVCDVSMLQHQDSGPVPCRDSRHSSPSRPKHRSLR